MPNSPAYKGPKTRLKSRDEYDALMEYRKAGKMTAPEQLKSDLAVRREHQKYLDISRLHRELVKEHEAALKREMDHADLKALMRPDQIKIRPKKLRKSGSKTKAKAEGAYVTPTGDWHVGETVQKRAVEGINEYTPEIAHERIVNYFRNTLWCCNKERGAGIDLHTCVLPVLGDLISGHIHPELVLNNSMTPIEETEFALRHLIDGIEFLWDHGKFKKMVVVCIIGNHGRLTQRMWKGKSAERTSFESLIYRLTAHHFKNNKAIEFVFEPSYATTIDIFDFRTRITHGHAFRYMGGVGGVTIPLIRWIGQKNAIHAGKSQGGRSMSVMYDILGHWHQLVKGQRFLINGSLIGTTPYSMEMGLSSPANQGSFVIRAGYPYPICENTVFVHKE